MKYLLLTLALLIAAPTITANDGPGKKRRSTYGVRKQPKKTSCRKAKRILNRRHR
jgi:hypothetical protein